MRINEQDKTDIGRDNHNSCIIPSVIHCIEKIHSYRLHIDKGVFCWLDRRRNPTVRSRSNVASKGPDAAHVYCTVYECVTLFRIIIYINDLQVNKSG